MNVNGIDEFLAKRKGNTLPGLELGKLAPVLLAVGRKGTVEGNEIVGAAVLFSRFLQLDNSGKHGKESDTEHKRYTQEADENHHPPSTRFRFRRGLGNGPCYVGRQAWCGRRSRRQGWGCGLSGGRRQGRRRRRTSVAIRHDVFGTAERSKHLSGDGLGDLLYASLCKAGLHRFLDR